MCGRFQLVSDENTLKATYPQVRIVQPTLFSNEIFPTQNVSTITNDLNLSNLDWGIKVSFTKRPIINARLETADQKELFRDAFFTNRCLIPMSGFYEWNQLKEKYLFKPRDYEIASFAGLVVATRIENKFVLQTALLTKVASSSMQNTHHRMPILIPPKDSIKYLKMDNSEIKTYLNQIDLPLEVRLVG